jgi:hypothetical protein
VKTPPSVAVVILRSLMTNLNYAKKVLPFLKPEYFNGNLLEGGMELYTELAAYINKYDSLPTKEQLIIELDDAPGYQEKIDAATTLAESIEDVAGDPVPMQWLEDETNTFITKQHKHNTIIGLIQADESDKPLAEFCHQLLTPPTLERDLPGLDTGLPDFLAKLREHNLHKEAVIPFDIEWLNRTVRGVRRKFLNVVLAGTNVGKTLWLCHLAAAYLRTGLSVLYITMEMDEWLLQNRIHANLLNIALEPDSTLVIPAHVQAPPGIGRLIVRGYLANSHTGLFRSYIADLKAKQQFKPDIILVDYLALCGSELLHGNNIPQYQILGSVSKELRSLAQQTDSVVWSAAQANRQGLTKGTSVNLTHTAESIQISYNADIILSLWNDEILPDRIHCSIEKHQTGAGALQHGLLAVDKARMRLYDISQSEQADSASVADAIIKSKAAKKKAKTAVVSAAVFEIDE